MRKISILVFFLSFVSFYYAQIPLFRYDYTPLESSGELPDFFTKTATEKAGNDLEMLKKDKDYNQDSRTKEKFYVESDFEIDHLIRSGKLVFNDSLSDFVNKVAQVTFRDVPELKNKLKILVLKSDIVNAYSTSDGLVLITMGLLAQLDNEAQLSFVLCHEAAHYYKKHSIESYINFNSRRTNYSTNEILDKYKYSQSNELEADVVGAAWFKQTNYSFKGLTGAFNVLKYSRLPFDEIKFEKGFLEDSNLVFPNSYYLAALPPINNEEDYDDSEKSHPNIKKRKDAVAEKLGEISEEGRQKFLVNKESFINMREMARFELCRIELLNNEYADCIYDCYLLTAKYPENKYLKKILGKALFQVAAEKSPERTDYKKVLKPPLNIAASNDAISYNADKYEGNLKRVYFLLDKLNAREISILALNYNWKLKNYLHGKDEGINQLCDSLFILLAVNNEVSSGYFSKLSRPEYIRMNKQVQNREFRPSASVDTSKNSIPVRKKMTTLNELDKIEDDSSKTTHIITYNTVKTGQAKRTLNADSILKVINDSILYSKLEDHYDRFAFSAFLTDSAFTVRLRSATARFDELEKNKEKNVSASEAPYNGGMGIDKIIILNPFYYKFDERNDDRVRYFDADLKLHQYTQILQDNAKLAGLDYEFIDSHTLKPNDVEKYNDFAMLNDWMNEYLSHGYNTNMLVVNNDVVEKMKNKYNTRFVLWSGIVNARLKKENVGALVILTLLVYPAPFTLPKLLRKEEKSVYLSVLFDLKYNRIVYYDTKVLRLSDKNDFLNSFTYSTMLTIKSSLVK